MRAACFINRCYDELNLSDPGLILSIHEEYLQAGAEILETNTFGANRFRLARHGLAAKVAGRSMPPASSWHARPSSISKKSRPARPGSPALSARSAFALSRWARPASMKHAPLLPSRFALWPKAASTC